MNKKERYRYRYYVGAALIPIVVLTVVYVVKGIYPFGKNTFLSADMLEQYVCFLTELSHKLKNGESLLYTWSRGLGQNYIAECAYYASSPFNIVLALFNAKQIPAVMNIMIIIRSGIAGVCMYTYLDKHLTIIEGVENNNGFCNTVLAVAYALCSYMIKYFQNVMWLDGFMLFPIVILGLELLVKKKSKVLYICSLAFVIFSNYYIGFMVCIFCAIYFVYFMIANSTDKEINKKRTIVRFALCSITAGMLCAVILIPTVYGLMNTQAKSVSYYSSVIVKYKFFVSFFRMMFMAKPTFPSNPYMYFSDIIFVLCPIYLLSKKIRKREKIGKILLMLFMMLSFQFPILSYYWNGMHQTNGLSGRNSFMFIFLGITICADIIRHDYECDKKLFLGENLFILCILLLVNMEMPYRETWHSILGNVFIIAIYEFMIMKKCRKNILFSFVLCEVVIATAGTITFNGITISEYNEQYDKDNEIIGSIKDNGFYRVKNDYTDLANEASLLNYNGISIYSSNANDRVGDYLYDLGFYCTLNNISCISDDPVFMSILGEKYVVMEDDKKNLPLLEKCENIDGVSVYENKQALSVAFEIPYSTYKCEYKGDNPFERINDFARTVDETLSIYNKLDVDIHKPVEISKGTYLYMYYKRVGEEASFISNGEKELVHYSRITLGDIMERGKNDKYIYYVNNSYNGGNLDLTELQDDSVELYELNVDDYKKLMNILSKCQLNVNEYTHDSIKGEIECDKDGVIMTSIPYEEGWSVKIDGKRVKSKNIKNALLCLEIKKGKHKIEMQYFPKGLKEGICISCLALIAIVFFGVICKKKEN